MTKPTVSVIMITYGHEQFIKQAIEGVLIQQCNFDVELIIADDCSPDTTESIVNDICQTHPNASWIKYTKHKNNLGMMPNFIFALQQAEGKYIALCEGDDYWTDPLKLQKQIDFLEANPDFVVCGHDAKIVNTNGELLKSSTLTSEYKRDATSLELKKGFWILTLTLVIRNVPILKNFPKEALKVINGDIFLISLLGVYGKYKYLNNIDNAAYRIHDGGVWSLKNDNFKNLQNIITRIIISKYYERVEPKISKELFLNNFKYADKILIKSLNLRMDFLIKMKLFYYTFYNSYKSKGILKSTPFFIKRLGRLIFSQFSK